MAVDMDRDFDNVVRVISNLDYTVVNEDNEREIFNVEIEEREVDTLQSKDIVHSVLL